MTFRQRWMLAIRPKTLPAAVGPVLMGCGLAATLEKFNWGAALAALFGAVMIQIGTNLVNDVVDYSKGADTDERLGPVRATQSGLLSPRQVWTGAALSFGLAVLAGIFLTWVAGWPVVAIGLASILAGVAYSAGPYPLASIGLGDLFVMVFFGFMAVCGTVFVVSGEVPEAAWWAGAAVGALAVNILGVNNIRDIKADRQANRRNIPVVFGRKAAEIEFGLMLVLAFIVPVLLVARHLTSWTVLFVFLSFPLGVKLLNRLRSGLEGLPLNPILGETAQLVFWYSVLFAFGMFLSLLLYGFKLSLPSESPRYQTSAAHILYA